MARSSVSRSIRIRIHRRSMRNKIKSYLVTQTQIWNQEPHLHNGRLRRSRQHLLGHRPTLEFHHPCPLSPNPVSTLLPTNFGIVLIQILRIRQCGVNMTEVGSLGVICKRNKLVEVLPLAGPLRPISNNGR